jgi:hypothetical protein
MFVAVGVLAEKEISMKYFGKLYSPNHRTMLRMFMLEDPCLSHLKFFEGGELYGIIHWGYVDSERLSDQMRSVADKPVS